MIGFMVKGGVNTNGQAMWRGELTTKDGRGGLSHGHLTAREKEDTKPNDGVMTLTASLSTTSTWRKGNGWNGLWTENTGER